MQKLVELQGFLIFGKEEVEFAGRLVEQLVWILRDCLANHKGGFVWTELSQVCSDSDKDF